MIEAVPRDPYGGYITDLLLVEKNMQLRRKRLHAVLRKNEIAPTSANFPMLGVEGYGHTEGNGGAVANSLYVSDRVINPHPRFGTLTKNIRQRRRGNVDIRIPRGVNNIGRLENEMIDDVRNECCDVDQESSISEAIKGIEGSEKRKNDGGDGDAHGSSLTDTVRGKGMIEPGNADTIHMDAMAFGMGCCCLQVGS